MAGIKGMTDMTKQTQFFNVVLVSNGAVLETKVERALAIEFKQSYGRIGRIVKIEKARKRAA